MDDNRVTAVAIETVLDCQAYVLLYARKMPIAEQEGVAAAESTAAPVNNTAFREGAKSSKSSMSDCTPPVVKIKTRPRSPYMKKTDLCSSNTTESLFSGKVSKIIGSYRYVDEFATDQLKNILIFFYFEHFRLVFLRRSSRRLFGTKGFLRWSSRRLVPLQKLYAKKANISKKGTYNRQPDSLTTSSSLSPLSRMNSDSNGSFPIMAAESGCNVIDNAYAALSRCNLASAGPETTHHIASDDGHPQAKNRNLKPIKRKRCTKGPSARHHVNSLCGKRPSQGREGYGQSDDWLNGNFTPVKNKENSPYYGAVDGPGAGAGSITRTKLAHRVFDANVDRGHLEFAVREYLQYFSCSTISLDTSRRSLDRSRFPRGKVPIHRVGDRFKFVNREQQCLELLYLFWCMYEIFISGGASDASKLLNCPAVLGLRGIGKSSFVREMLAHILSIFQRSGLSDEVLFQQMQSAGLQLRGFYSSVVISGGITKLDESKFAKFLAQLRSDKLLNLTVPLDEMSGVKNPDTDKCVHAVCIAILYTSLKYKIGGEGVDGNLDKQNYEEFYSYVNAASPKLLTISKTLAVVARVTGASAVLINLDEVNFIATESLCKLLQQLKSVVRFGCMGTAEVPLYFTLSGIFHASIARAVDSSGMKMLEVVLPLLSENHMIEVITDLLGVKRLFVGPYLSNLLWLLGGVPRHLAFALEYLAVIARDRFQVQPSDGHYDYIKENSLKCLLESLDSSTLYGTAQLVAIKSGAAETYKNNIDVISRLVALVVSEYSVPGDFQLRQHGDCSRRPVYDMDAAKHDQLVYHAADGSILIPPLTLSSMHRSVVICENNATNVNHMVFVLHTLRDYLGVRENESIYVAVLLQRMKAAVALNIHTIPLPELLGVDPEPTVWWANITVKPIVAGFITLKEKLDNFNMAHYIQQASEPVHAFINGFQAEYGDACLLLEEVVIVVQEKLTAVDKLASTSSNKLSAASAADPEDHLIAEYKKVFGEGGDVKLQTELKKWLGGRRLLFVYITDSATRIGRPRCKPHANIPTDMIVITNDMHKRCFGALVARLRSHTVARDLSGCTTICSVKRRNIHNKFNLHC